MFGFFTREQAKPMKRKSVAGSAYLNKSGCLFCPYNKSDTKDVKPSGPTDADLYLLGESPSFQDTESGLHFSSDSFTAMRRLFRSIDKIRMNYCVRSYAAKTSKTVGTALECCRKSVEDDIAAVRPKIIVGIGALPIKWALKANYSATLCRGRLFPVRVKDWVCWFFPILDPVDIDKQSYSRGDYSGSDLQFIFERDIHWVVRNIDKLPTPEVELPESIDSGIFPLDCSTQSLELIEDLLQADTITIDIETNCLRPYAENAKIISISLATDTKALSFLYEHKRASWSPLLAKRLDTVLAAALTDRNKVFIAQNAAFELEWLISTFGKDVSMSLWHDTMVQAYYLDERQGGLGLEFLSILHFGFNLKAQSELAGDLEEIPESVLLRYNALDAKYEAKLYRKQAAELEHQGMKDAYIAHLAKIPAVVLSQIKGVLVDLDEVFAQRDALEQNIEDVLRIIMDAPEVEQYKRKFAKEFNPASSADLIRMFSDVLRRHELSSSRTSKAALSTDSSVLTQMTDCEFAKHILTFREHTKSKSTYLDSLIGTSKKEGVIWDDCKIHTVFATTMTATGRLSSRDPNMQNFPKRKHKEVRRVIVAPDRHSIISADYGQIEARVIAMAARDKKMIDALWNNYDVHMEWAEIIAEEFPNVMKKYKNIKELRSVIKNQFVFPAFYGASHRSIASAIGVNEDDMQRVLNKFWVVFSGVKVWQETVINKYRQHGYVTCLTGRRRHGPLSKNMILNSPIQGTASDIVLEAMIKLSRLAIATGIDYFQPVLNIHDDLTFYVPDSCIEEAVAVIVEYMLTMDFKWINVPLSVEVAVGKNWCDMDEIGTFTSQDV